mmetsp:Transcript_50400/g.100248  ORF Transcript_50400/g.100248 Transcript_50400/m.100248 type:complete len:211 (-) Transcript_50400:1962-2594(-)
MSASSAAAYWPHAPELTADGRRPQCWPSTCRVQCEAAQHSLFHRAKATWRLRKRSECLCFHPLAHGAGEAFLTVHEVVRSGATVASEKHRSQTPAVLHMPRNHGHSGKVQTQGRSSWHTEIQLLHQQPLVLSRNLPRPQGQPSFAVGLSPFRRLLPQHRGRSLAAMPSPLPLRLPHLQRLGAFRRAHHYRRLPPPPKNATAWSTTWWVPR